MDIITPSWYYKLDRVPSTARYVLACDTNAGGSKKFGDMGTYSNMVAYAEANRGYHLYEVLKDGGTLLYFDIDMDHPKYPAEQVIPQLLGAIRACLMQRYNIDAPLRLGEDCQMCFYHIPEKLSIHVVCGYVMPTMADHKIFNQLVVQHIVDNAISELLFVDVFGKVGCVLDASVYSRSRCFRIMSMIKMGKGMETRLLPYGGSAPEIAEHLVGYHPGHNDYRVRAHLPKGTQVPPHVLGAVPRSLQLLPRPGVLSEGLISQDQDVQAFVDALTTNPHLCQQLGVDEVVFSYKYKVDNGWVSLFVDKARCTAVCPLANRVHRHNNMALMYRPDHPRQFYIKCFDEDCRDLPKPSYVMYSPAETAALTHDMCLVCSLHSQAGVIPWAERYSEDHMRAYPRGVPLLCIRAGMGTGKTAGLQAFAHRHFAGDTTALIITFSRSLAVKYLQDFGPLGFVSYMDVKETYIRHPKVIVCLDSLWRVTTRKPTYVILDEALTVFLHFNSPHMLKGAQNSVLLELLVTQARQVILMDACMDHVFMYDIMRYFERSKRVEATWIWNEFIRPTNRRAHIHLTTCVAVRTASAGPCCWLRYPLQRCMLLVLLAW